MLISLWVSGNQKRPARIAFRRCAGYLSHATQHEETSMDANTVAVLQVVASIVQGVAAMLVIPITFYAALKGADRGAQKAYELNERAAQDRDRREQVKQQLELGKQTKSLRLLLGLEVRQNLNDLEWLRHNLLTILGDEKDQYYNRKGMPVENAEAYAWFEARQRFISSYMPDWGHRFWHGQQAAHLLPVALQEWRSVKSVSFTLNSTVSPSSEICSRRGHSSAMRGAGRRCPLSFKEDAPRLWDEFISTVNQILDLGSTLADNLQAFGAERLRNPDGASNKSLASPQIEPRTDSLKPSP